MTDDEKDFIRKINVDKAIKKLTKAIALIVISITTYIIPLVFGDFDFGIIFEIVSLVFLLIGRFYMLKYDEINAKKYVICSMIAIGWLVIYDTIIVFQYFFHVNSIGEAFDLGYGYFIGEILSILYLLLLFAVHKDLAKADNPIKYKESTDWFYEKYEEDKK